MNLRLRCVFLLIIALLLASCNEKTTDEKKKTNVKTEIEAVSNTPEVATKITFSEQDYRNYIEYMMELERSITVNYDFSFKVIDSLKESESYMRNVESQKLIKDIRGNAFHLFTLAEESVFPVEYANYHNILTHALGKISRGAMLVDNIFLEQDMKWVSEATTTLDDGLKYLDEAITIREEATRIVLGTE